MTEREEKFIALWKEGVTTQDIADTLGVSLSTVSLLSRKLRESGFIERRRQPRAMGEQDARELLERLELRDWMVHEHHRGRTYGDIGEELGVSRQRIGQLINRQYLVGGKLV